MYGLKFADTRVTLLNFANPGEYNKKKSLQCFNIIGPGPAFYKKDHHGSTDRKLE